ncbi:hypothetical protein J2T09_004722 [Neorhizobium huautlense]|uniref:Uncharacterized protein n=1 Tax=Neorhizobium huautlense TaxID=67774 RepID=A0ABT9PZP7_9HYPH|nr:hypothetical protein [Neorhizobium huautlense]MDP9839942.1 hypothetical protein [Neorhizobium huautlense]
MSDNSTTTIRAIFATREEADLAVEHLVQKHGVLRPDIFVQAEDAENTVGSAPSGGDMSRSKGARRDAPIAGDIEVSADIAADQPASIQRTMGEIGAMRVSGR